MRPALCALIRAPENCPRLAGPMPYRMNNPFSGGGKFNEGGGKAAGFTDRMLQSEGILSGVGGQGGVQGQGTSAVQTALSAIPPKFGFDEADVWCRMGSQRRRNTSSRSAKGGAELRDGYGFGAAILPI